MILTLNTSTKTFRYTFTFSLLVFSIILFAAASYSWTGPTGTAPNSNVSAPINVGATSQVKSGALSVNGLSVYGSQYIEGYLGIGASASSPWRIYAPGSSYGIYAEATTGQAIRGASTGGGYAGYFVGGGGGGGVYAQNSGGYYAFLGYPGSSWSVYANGPTYTGSYVRADGGVQGYYSGGYGGYFTGYGGVYAQNTSGYYAYLGYPGTSWSVYSNGNTYSAGYSRADGGFCIGGSCITSWPTSSTISFNSAYWTSWVSTTSGSGITSSCASGYAMTGVETQSFPMQTGAGGEQGYTSVNYLAQRILCTRISI